MDKRNILLIILIAIGLPLIYYGMTRGLEQGGISKKIMAVVGLILVGIGLMNIKS